MKCAGFSEELKNIPTKVWNWYLEREIIATFEGSEKDLHWNGKIIWLTINSTEKKNTGIIEYVSFSQSLLISGNSQKNKKAIEIKIKSFC